MLANYKNWIFDWSGTIVDDMALVVDATNHVMAHYKKPQFDRESFRSSFRLPYGEWYAEIIPNVPLEEIEQHFRKGFELSAARVPVLPYAREFLEALKAGAKRIFVCTSMDTAAFEDQASSHKLDHFFQQTYSSVLNKKKLITQILQEHQLTPSETIFIGDMIHDIETAHHGEIDSLAVLTGYNTKAELESARPSYLVRNYSELLWLACLWAIECFIIFYH